MLKYVEVLNKKFIDMFWVQFIENLQKKLFDISLQTNYL